jgi:hypothetical protein
MLGRIITAAWSKRAAATAAALLTAAGVGSGCDVAGSQDEASPAPQTPKEALIASVPDGSEGRYRFTVTDADMTSTGEVDPTAKGVHIASAYTDKDLGFTMNMAFLVVDQQAWTRITFTDTKSLTGLPELPDNWLRLDPTKVKDPDSMPLAFDGADPVNATSLLRSAVSANDKGSGRFDGTLDLTRASDAEVVDPDGLTALGEAAKAVPFTATVDAGGRLASITVEVPAAGETPAHQFVVTYADYGSAPAVSPPVAAEATDAPAAAYELLNA